MDPTASQKRAIRHGEGALLVLGAAGTGKSEVLARRLVALSGNGAAPERIAVLTSSAAAADRIRGRAEDLLEGAYEEISVLRFDAFAERLLRDHAAEAGLDPFFERVGAADRFAMLLDRLDELSLRRHEIRGDPAGLLRNLIERIDAFKAAGLESSELRGWAAERERLAEREDEIEAARRELEFAELWTQHDEILSRGGNLDSGQLLLEATRLLRRRADARVRVSARFRWLMVDELEDTSRSEWALLGELTREHGNVVAACDDDQRIRNPVPGTSIDAAFRERHPEAETVVLESGFRGGRDVLDAARAVVAPLGGRLDKPLASQSGEIPVRFWRCANERAQAQAAAREIERLISTGEAVPDGICVVVGSPERDGRLVCGALEERSVPFRVAGAASFFGRTEVRDVLAWLRMLADPADSAAVVRAITRPPVDLRPVDLARCTTIARRRKLDMVSALEAALESPQLPPEARDRIQGFLKLYRSAAGALEELRPDVFVRRLIERVGMRRQQLFGANPETAERLLALSRLGELAAAWGRREPQGSTRDFVRYLAAVAEAGDLDRREWQPKPPAVRVMGADEAKGEEFDHVFILGLTRGPSTGEQEARRPQIPEGLLAREAPEPERRRRLLYTAMTRARASLVLAWPEATEAGPARPSPMYEDARTVLDASEVSEEEDLFGPGEGLQSTYRMIREEVLDQAWRVGGTLSELRLDTYMDVNRAVARYLELLKLGALIQRPGEQPVGEALEAINELLRQVSTPETASALGASALDSYVVDEERGRARRRELIAARDEPSLEGFLPRRGQGLALSASDIELYRTCPLKYKFARVFAIPQEQTINQRFGILIHRVLERFHAEEDRRAGRHGSEQLEGWKGPELEGHPDLRRLLALLDAGWRRAGFGASDDELQFRDRAVAALARYYERQRASAADPVWLERSFDFRVGAHHLRGRVDRVDRLPEGGYELIDYKTGEPKSAEELRGDVQLAIYNYGAREAWRLEPAAQSYYYVLDDEKVALESSTGDLERVERTVLEVGEGITEQDFEPQPSYEVCSWCDYRLVCPAAEA